jgi:hypothetical protein
LVCGIRGETTSTPVLQRCGLRPLHERAHG